MSDPRPHALKASGTSAAGAGAPRGGPPPDFDEAMTRVAGYAEPHHEVVARIFVPLSLTDGGYLTWSGAARSLGIDLTATRRWTSSPMRPEPEAWISGCPSKAASTSERSRA